jgi:hypothetical protein
MTERTLQDFFDRLRLAQQANRANFPVWYDIIESIDRCLMLAGENLTNPKPPMTGNLLLRCQYAFKTAAGMSLAGQVVEAFVMQRSISPGPRIWPSRSTNLRSSQMRINPAAQLCRVSPEALGAAGQNVSNAAGGAEQDERDHEAQRDEGEASTRWPRGARRQRLQRRHWPRRPNPLGAAFVGVCLSHQKADLANDRPARAIATTARPSSAFAAFIALASRPN